MQILRRLPTVLPVLAAFPTFLSSSCAFAQVQAIASEPFAYTWPGLVHDQSGGSGWASSWAATAAPNHDDVVLFSPAVPGPPPFPLGGSTFAGQAHEFGYAERVPDPSGHSSVVENGRFGRDGGTIWVSLSSMRYMGTGLGHYFGGLSLMNGTTEELLLGNPWGLPGWGLDDEASGGAPPVVVAGSDDAQAARLVLRIDYLPGPERARLWLNPAVPHPNCDPDLDVLLHDHRFGHIRIWSGGNGQAGNPAHFFYDGINLDAGASPIGSSFCSPATPNSSGAPALVRAFGCVRVSAQDITLRATQLPPGQPGYFLVSQGAGSFSPPGSQGVLCLSGSIGRYNQLTNVIVGPSGSLRVDLTALPLSPPVAVAPGQTWRFQCWYRDLNPQPTSNFTDAVALTFQ
ncbi:MAG: hypothetical protein GY711_21410 [bacterium]|nr:hypothetical protein [bacterium]